MSKCGWTVGQGKPKLIPHKRQVGLPAQSSQQFCPLGPVWLFSDQAHSWLAHRKAKWFQCRDSVGSSLLDPGKVWNVGHIWAPHWGPDGEAHTESVVGFTVDSSLFSVDIPQWPHLKVKTPIHIFCAVIHMPTRDPSIFFELSNSAAKSGKRYWTSVHGNLNNLLVEKQPFSELFVSHLHFSV